MTDTAKARYDALKVTRQPFLDRARRASALTIPSLIPPEGHNPATPLPEPNQGLGARLVVHLASYFTDALLPPGRAVFRLGVSPKALIASGQPSVPPELEAQLALVERIPHNEIERRNWRAATNTSNQHLLVAGNVMEKMLPDNSIVIHPLDRYVVVRDPAGNMIEFIVEEPLDAASLPAKLAAMRPSGVDAPGTQRYCLYTWGKFDAEANDWAVHQEFEERSVEGSDGHYAADLLPYFALRWAVVAGEDYGRGKVEEHIADFRSLDGLSKAMRDGAAMASRNVTMIRPSAAAGINMRRKLSKADNGEYIIGNPEDVQMLQFTNTNGLQIVQVELQTLRQELGAAFMLTSATTRNAERVTAEEIRNTAQELDSVQGGAYSMLSLDMLRPRVGRLLYQMKRAGELPNYPDGAIDATILTGLAALGRENDTNNVVSALGILKGYPPEVYDYIKWTALLRKGFSGLDLSDAVRTDQEVAAVRAQQQQQQTAHEVVTQSAAPVAQAAAQAAAAPAQ